MKLGTLFLLVSVPLLAPRAGAGEGPPLEPVPLRDVRLLDGPFRDAQQRGLAVLLDLEPDRLLHTFRTNAGLPTTARPYGGWEAPTVELRGHSLGHYLTACALMYEATGDERLKHRMLAAVTALREVQRSLARRGMSPGYLSAFPEELFDRVEAREPVWAPYYTLHKIMAGLLDVYRVTGEPAALEAVEAMAAWVGTRAERLTAEQWQDMLGTEFGGMQDVLTALFVTTGEDEHLRLARLFDHHAVFDPLARGEDPLDGLHANTQIPKAIGAARDCAATGDPRYCAVAETFWRQVALRRSYVIGGDSEDEHFFPVTHFSRHLGESTAETCNTYNMLKLSHLLFLRDGDPRRMDFYERGLFNHILASQDPATGRVTYYVALKPGAWRTYSTPEDSFWCCVGTGMENPARYGEAVYARQGDALLVDLFLSSELRWSEKGLRLRQETRFPDEDRTRITIDLEAPARFALRVRHPSWAEGALSMRLNGRPLRVESRPGSWATIERQWHDGDAVEVRLPLRLRFEAMPDDPTVGALLYGPIVLAADLGPAPGDSRYGPEAPEMRPEDVRALPALFADRPEDAITHLEPAGASLAFRTAGLSQPRNLELRPFFRLADRRYSVYVRVQPESAWREREAAATAADERRAAELAARTLDAVTTGDADDERAHALEETGTWTGWLDGRPYRFARRGTGFSYTLRPPAAGPVALRVAYWGGETRPRRFDVVVEGEVVATQELFDDRPGEVLPVEYTLPRRLLEGRESVRVGFETGPAGATGAVFEVRLVRPAPAPAPP
jgi:DUF1680 family protein